MRAAAHFTLAGHAMAAQPSGALFWPDERALFVSDLHFGKGASYAASGQLLPPYDTHATLARLAGEIEALDPQRVICLGDSFHRADSWARFDARDADALKRMARHRAWIWIAGNHDPDPPAEIGGQVMPELQINGIACRHQADPASRSAELSGHFHPVASVRMAGRRVTRPCFVSDGRRAILPAFGAFAGGLDVRDPAFAPLFPSGIEVLVLGHRRVHRFGGRDLG